MTELKRIHQLMTHLKRRLAVGGMTYNEAVTVDQLIAVFERMAAEIEIRHPDIPAVPETALDVFLRGTSS